jgi:hypothetical protein
MLARQGSGRHHRDPDSCRVPPSGGYAPLRVAAQNCGSHAQRLVVDSRVTRAPTGAIVTNFCVGRLVDGEDQSRPVARVPDLDDGTRSPRRLTVAINVELPDAPGVVPHTA